MQREAYLKRLVILWRIRLALFCLPFLIIAFFISKEVFLAAFIGALLIIAVFVPLYFKKCKLSLSDNLLIFENGIIFKTTRVIPYEKIILMKCVKTPLSYRFGLVLVIIRTVGGVIILPELDHNSFKELKSRVEEAAD